MKFFSQMSRRLCLQCHSAKGTVSDNAYMTPLLISTGCSVIINGPALTESIVGAPGVSEMTARNRPLASNSGGIIDALVLMSNGSVILVKPWKKTA